MAKLVLQSGNDPRLSYQLQQERITIGRDASNQIVLSDPSVSHVHAEISHHGKLYSIRDLASTNGIYVNGERLTQGNLRNKDRIRLGDTTFVYLENSDDYPGAGVGASIPFSEISLPLFAIRDLESVQRDFEGTKDDVHAKGDEKDYSLLSAFYQLNLALTKEKDFKEMVKDVLIRVLETVKGDTGIVFLGHSQQGFLEPFLAVKGLQGIPVNQVEYSKTLLKKAVDSGEAILTSNAMADERFEGVPSVVANKIYSAMCVPMRTRKETFGVIQIDTRSPHPGFTKTHLEVLIVMAREIAIHFENIRLRNELKAVMEKLHGIDKMRSNFITVIGYQIATPITVMDQYFRLLKEGLLGPTDPKQRKALEVLQRHSERLKYVVRDLERVLSWEVISKKMKLSMVEFDLRETVDLLLPDITGLFENKNQKFHWERPVHPVKLMANKDTIREVISHLLINAYKFTPEGTQIVLDIQDAPDRVVVKIEDYGVGLSPEVLAQVFDSFYVGDENLAFAQTAPMHLSRSLGLGLYLSKKIVEGHGGKIWAESDVGKFCRFSFFLPKSQPGEAR